MHDTVVVGAGMAGLAYAHARGAGSDVVVLEGGDRAGGLVKTHREDDFHVEEGPEALADNEPEMVAFLEELGLGVSPADPAAAKRYVLTADGLVPVPTGPGAFLKSPLLGWPSKLRALSEPFRSRDGGLEGSVADFIRHRLGQAVLAKLVDPAVSGIYAGDAETLSLRATFPMLYELVSEHGSILSGMKARAKARRARGEPRPGPPSLLSVEGGLDGMAAAVAEFLGERLVLDCPVTRVARAPDGWRVEAKERVWTSRRVVVALPARPAAAVLAEDVPALSQELGSFVSETVVSVAHLWPRADVADPLDAFGYLVPSSLERSHLGTLMSSSIQPARCPSDVVILRTLLGGARNGQAAQLDDDMLVDLVVDDVGPILGLSGRPRWTRVSRWRSALPRYDLEQPARQARIDALLDGLPGLSIVGNHRRGISVNALVASSRALGRRHVESPEPA